VGVVREGDGEVRRLNCRLVGGFGLGRSSRDRRRRSFRGALEALRDGTSTTSFISDARSIKYRSL